MKHVITFQFTNCNYAVHAVGCRAAKSNDHQNAWEFEGTVEQAVYSCHQDEQEKSDDENARAVVKVCKCAK